jgi:hypothetical protein
MKNRNAFYSGKPSLFSGEIRNYYIISVIIIDVVTIFREHFSDCKARSGRWLWDGTMLNGQLSARTECYAPCGDTLPPSYPLASSHAWLIPENTEISMPILLFFLRFLDFRDM